MLTNLTKDTYQGGMKNIKNDTSQYELQENNKQAVDLTVSVIKL